MKRESETVNTIDPDFSQLSFNYPRAWKINKIWKLAPPVACSGNQQTTFKITDANILLELRGCVKYIHFFLSLHCYLKIDHINTHKQKTKTSAESI